jgi:uncharacterized protein (DUF1778 family)
MSDEKIIRAVLANGKVLIRQADGSYCEARGQTDWERVNARTDDEVEVAARADADALPLEMLADRRVFELDETRWAAFMEALGTPPENNPRLRPRGLKGRGRAWLTGLNLSKRQGS